jgi:pimeloyl-ACP methyl ester carboxylesterase
LARLDLAEDFKMTIQQRESWIQVGASDQVYLKEKWRDDAPRGPAILMIHGYNSLGALGNYDVPVKDFSAMDLLAARGYDVFALDLRGFGKSAHPGSIGWEDNVSDVHAATTFIREQRGGARVTLLGGSYGGAITYTVASRYPDLVDRLVLLATPYRAMKPEGRAMLNMLAQVAEQKKMTYIPVPASDRPDAATINSDPDVIKWRFEISQTSDLRVPIPPLREMFTFAAADAVRGVRASTLVVVGDKDFIVSIEDTLALLNDLGASEKSLIVVGNAGHGLMYETQHRYIWGLIAQGLPPVSR